MAEANDSRNVVVDFSGKKKQKRKDGGGSKEKIVKRKSVRLSSSERSAIKQVFDSFDINGDGKITVKEFEETLKRLTSSNDLDLSTDCGVEVMLEQMGNNTEEIDADTFEQFYLNTFSQEDVKLRDAFNMFDT